FFQAIQRLGDFLGITSRIFPLCSSVFHSSRNARALRVRADLMTDKARSESPVQCFLLDRTAAVCPMMTLYLMTQLMMGLTKCSVKAVRRYLGLFVSRKSSSVNCRAVRHARRMAALPISDAC